MSLAPVATPIQTLLRADFDAIRSHFSPWCHSWQKRVFDVTIALMLFGFSLPLLGLIAAAILATSRGPILFPQKRVGERGKDFYLFKFRSMNMSVQGNGSALTRAGDGRITRVGRVLRKWKLDELPQLLNVLRGEISMVGPRPHVRRLLADNEDVHRLLSLRPGITGYATLHYRDEENILPEMPPLELEAFYIAKILPAKVALEFQYARTATCLSDSILILKTAAAVLWGRRKTARSIAAVPDTAPAAAVPEEHQQRAA